MNYGGFNQYKKKPSGCIGDPSTGTVNPVHEESFAMFCARQKSRCYGKASVIIQRVEKRRKDRIAALLAECEADMNLARQLGRRRPDADSQA